MARITETTVKREAMSALCSAFQTCSNVCMTEGNGTHHRYYGGKNGDVFLGGSDQGATLSTDMDPHAGVADGGFGLDTYEPHFADWSIGQWRHNRYSVRVQITDEATHEFFYFCHIHQWMSGRVIVLSASNEARPGIRQELYAPEALTSKDTTCGSTPAPHYGDADGPSAFGLDSKKCPTMHLCGAKGDFRDCMEAIDCHMTYK